MVIRRADEWLRSAERFRREAGNATTLRDLGALFTRTMRPLGVTAYAMGHLKGGGRSTTIFLTTWPRRWMELYAANAFINEDPVVAEALVSSEPFTLDELRARRDIESNRVLEEARKFGFEQAFAIPVHGPNDTVALVALVASRLHMTASERGWVAEEARACLAVAQRLFDREARPAALPTREREALALVAEGRDDASIGEALGITRASAHAYVERAKRRLGASTRAQAVAMALSDGLL